MSNGDGGGRNDLRMPDEDEVFAEVVEMLGANRVRVRCADGKSGPRASPGGCRSVWIREDDIVLVEPWDWQDEKGRHRVALREERGRTAPGGRPPPVNRVRRALAILSPNGPEQTYAPARDDDGRRDVRTRARAARRPRDRDRSRAGERAGAPRLRGREREGPSDDDDEFDGFDAGFVYPSRLMEGVVVDARLSVPWVNDREAVLTSRNKAGVLAALDAAGIPTPRTTLVSNPVDEAVVTEAVAPFSYPVVVKPNSATRGVGVATATDLDSLLGVVDYLNLVHDYRATGDKSYLIQEFSPTRATTGRWSSTARTSARSSGNPPDAVEGGGGNTTSTAARRPPVSTSRTAPASWPSGPRRHSGSTTSASTCWRRTDGWSSDETNARPPTVDAATKYKPDFYDRLAGLIERTPREKKGGCGYSRSIEAESSSRSNTTSNTPLLNVASAECSSTGTGSSTVSSYSRRSDAAEMVSAPVALQGELILRDGREVGDESHAVVGGVRVHVRRRAEAGVLASGVPVGHLVHHPFDLLEEVAERIVTVVSIHTSREVADPDKPSVHDRLRRRSGSCRRYAATLSIGRHPGSARLACPDIGKSARTRPSRT